MSDTPSDLRYNRQQRQLAVVYADGSSHVLSAEFLRVHSPSAEVRGHGEGQEVLQVGKEQVAITGLEPVGNYGLKIIFSDGHATGIYSWAYLRELGEGQDRLWQVYLDALAVAGHTRKTDFD